MTALTENSMRRTENGIHEKANLHKFRFLYSVFQTGSQGQRPRPSVPPAFSLSFSEKRKLAGLKKALAFYVRKAECGEQKTEFVKLAFNLLTKFDDSTCSPGGGFFGRLCLPQNDGVDLTFFDNRSFRHPPSAILHSESNPTSQKLAFVPPKHLSA